MIRHIKNCLRIVDLEILCIIGLFPHERTQSQRLILNAELDVDFKEAKAQGTDLISGVDYGLVADYLSKEATRGQYGLLEDLVQDLAYGALRKFPDLHGLILRATKPDIIKECKGVEAEIQLSRRPIE